MSRANDLRPGCGCAFVLVLAAAIALAAWAGNWLIALGGLALAFLGARLAESHRKRRQSALPPQQTPQSKARARLDAFLQDNPDWGFRCYETPGGLRLLATHRIFSPQEPEVARCFQALGADPVYARMCLRQNCFRARVSPKPWRLGNGSALHPRGVWPVAEDRLAKRRAWVETYERAAQDHAACRFTEAVGSRGYDRAVDAVQRLHDALSRAESGLPIA